MTGGQVRLKKRPSLADKKKSTDPSKLFVRPCSPDGSSRSSRKASSDDSGSAKSSTSTFPKKRPKKPRAFSTNSFPKGSRDSSPKSSSRCGSASEGASPKSSRPHSPPGSPKSRSSTSSTFRRWGSPYPPISKNSTRHCSPDYTVVDFEDTGGAFPELKKLIHSKIPRGSPSPELALKFVGGKNPVSKRLLQVMMYAATARAPFPEPKVRKLLFYKNTDKVDLIDQLQSLKAAVADQAYHFQLHKTQLHGLQNEQNELEEKLAALESIDGSNAPRTGGKGRLKSKISGLRVMIGNLTDDITKQKETIQNLKYRYQVSLTREVTIQRDLATGGVWRLQKQVRNTRDFLWALTKHNKKFLHLRDKILPDLREGLKLKQEKIRAEFSYLMFENASVVSNYTEMFPTACANSIFLNASPIDSCTTRALLQSSMRFDPTS
ncbi:hypothetical protein KC19_VG021000 [Ceratodon purpureus]|uniref:Uncharacterized protein n=1 Tax=Ceratodon purpureus TaxID=3225 RepID=A0A8T0HL68_CERPU|nr:hypothetical protein KC19_VG021000 [Ceratodon purpureus]